jgi:PurA-like ssDNA and RNA-binding protein
MINENLGVQSELLATEKFVTDRKKFFIDLKVNQRGRFLKITEDVGGRRDTIIVPVQALPDFMSALQRISDAEKQLPSE